MTEHVCEWVVDRYEPLAYCEGCMVEEQVVTFLDRDEIQRRLNATGRLSAKMAHKWYMKLHGEQFREIALALHNYADILEGK